MYDPGEKMSTGRQTMRDLAEEAKKRVVLLLICIFGLSYLMSLTSSSVWVNLPVAAAVIICSLYLSRELDIRKISAMPNRISNDEASRKVSVELLKIPLEKSDWKDKVNSPVVAAAIEQLTRHLVSEWVVDLWYSRITPDRDGPEALVQIMNGVIAEIACRSRVVNLIDLLTRDVVNLICNNLELYRYVQSKIGKQEIMKLPVDQRDVQLKLVLSAENKLHPALFSIEAEHKVLQNLVNGLISMTFKTEDLQCSFFRYTARELLACTVVRPILNLINPRFINERIESLVLSHANKAKRLPSSIEEVTVVKVREHSAPSEDQISGTTGHSSPGVELVPFKNDTKNTNPDPINITNGMYYRRKGNDPGYRSSSNLVPSIGNHFSVNSESSYVSNSQNSSSSNLSVPDSQDYDGKGSGTYVYGNQWSQMLDIISRRKSQALAPEHLDNVWAKGRNYKKKETNRSPRSVAQNSSTGNPNIHSGIANQDAIQTNSILKKSAISPKLEYLHVTNNNDPTVSNSSSQETKKHRNHEHESASESSYTTEDDENNTVTGLDSPGTRVWDSKNKKSADISSIRHPLETSEIKMAKKSGLVDVFHHRSSRTRTSSGRKRSRSRNQNTPLWQEVERTTFLQGDTHDILNTSKKDTKSLRLRDDSDVEVRSKIYNEAVASSFSSVSASESSYSSMKSPDTLALVDTFLKLRCEVLGANIVKSGSGTFAVYSISVTDANNNSWFIKRRFRHFEELHRLLKEYPEYNLHLPPKHFLSSGLEVPVVQERCKLLDIYLKKLLQIRRVSQSIEVLDFLSIDSLAYVFTDSLSIIQTLSVNLDDKAYEKATKSINEDVNPRLFSEEKILSAEIKDNSEIMRKSCPPGSDGLTLRKPNTEQIAGLATKKTQKNLYQDDSGSDPENSLINNVSFTGEFGQAKKDLTEVVETLPQNPKIVDSGGGLNIPTEWVPPNLSIPILNLVDVIFQLKDGGWIRRQAFWIAKQLLQLGMGDAFDDWLIEKIQLLRRGLVIASAIKRVEQILWPDGIFITKHPKRKATPSGSSPGTQNNQKNNPLTAEQQLEADRRAKFVHELIIDKAPAALVSLVGRKEYEQCALDVYFFLQSPLCLKQFALELLELLLLSAFPELSDVVKQCHQETQQFNEGNR